MTSSKASIADFQDSLIHALSSKCGRESYLGEYVVDGIYDSTHRRLFEKTVCNAIGPVADGFLITFTSTTKDGRSAILVKIEESPHDLSELRKKEDEEAERDEMMALLFGEEVVASGLSSQVYYLLDGSADKVVTTFIPRFTYKSSCHDLLLKATLDAICQPVGRCVVSISPTTVDGVEGILITVTANSS